MLYQVYTAYYVGLMHRAHVKRLVLSGKPAVLAAGQLATVPPAILLHVAAPASHVVWAAAAHAFTSMAITATVRTLGVGHSAALLFSQMPNCPVIRPCDCH